MKKGFTLVELLAIIIILAMIFTLAYPKIVEILEKNRKKVQKYQLELIYNAADDYVSENNLTTIGGFYCIDIKELISRNLIPIDVEDYKDKAVEITIGESKNAKKIVDLCNGSYDSTVTITVKHTTEGDIIPNLYGTVSMEVYFNNKSDETDYYYIKSTGTATVDENIVTHECGNQVDPTNCSSTTDVTLKPNYWYKVSKTILVTYTEPTLNNQTIYGAIYNGKRYNQIKTMTIPRLFYRAYHLSYTTSYNSEVKTVEDALDDLHKKLY